MKKLILVLVILAAVSVAHAGATLSFTTGPASGVPSWTVTEDAGTYTMSFTNIEVDTASVAGDAVINDFVGLPDLVFSNINTVTIAGVTTIIADLTPAAGLTITNDVAPVNVFSANLADGAFLKFDAFGTWSAYGIIASDLTGGATTLAGYSAVLDEFVATTNTIDFNIDGQNGTALQTLIMGGTGSVSGTLSGSITVVPAPGAMILGSIGVSFVGWLRRRRSL